MPSIPLAPRLARKRSRLGDCGKKASTSRIGIDELTHTSASSGSVGLERGEQLRLEAGRARRPARPAPCASAARQPVEPGGIGLARCASPARAASASSTWGRRRARSTSSARRVGSCQAPWGSITHLRRLGQPGAQRLGGGRVAHAQHQVGPVAAAKRSHAQQHVVVGHHVRAVVVAAAHARGGLGQQRPAGLRGQPRGGLGHVLGAGPAHDRAARARRPSRVGELLHVVRVAARWRARAARSRAARRARPSQSAASSSSGAGASGSRSGKFRCTGPGRPPRAVHQARQASARWWIAGLAPGLVVAHLHEPLGGAAVELDLVDRLARRRPRAARAAGRR